MKQVAVVICNYNKRELVIECIDSVLNSKFADFSVIVVDNASTDGSSDSIRERFSERVTLICNAENTGGSGGFGRGMDYAVECGFKYIHLLDNDAVVAPCAIGALYEFMETHADTGVCGSLIYTAGSDTIQEYGANVAGMDVDLLYRGQRQYNKLPEYLRCDYVAACSAMYRTSVLKQTGTIDRDYFIYWDDLDLSWRIRNSGYDVCAYAKSVVWHHGSFVNRSSLNRYYSFRNKIHCLVKHLSDDEFNKLSEVLTHRLFRMLAVNRHNLEYSQAYLYALDDALNGIRGKAEDYKVISRSCEHVIPEGKRIVNVSHVLDVGKYDRDAVYADPYQNVLTNDRDFDFAENLENYYQVFRDLLENFIECKLRNLRKVTKI